MFKAKEGQKMNVDVEPSPNQCRTIMNAHRPRACEVPRLFSKEEKRRDTCMPSARKRNRVQPAESWGSSIVICQYIGQRRLTQPQFRRSG